ncbi:MAG: two-component system capsular synthesis sensor histidine kinase RcsC [Myxococcota bacterium]|jgi:two-component system capsular synthesis sensor histidine kinase RcsC
MSEAVVSLILVEDDHHVGIVIRRLLERRNIRVVLVRTAMAALAVLSKRDFNVLLSDVHMPGMTGLELCERISPAMRSRTVLYTGAPEGIVPPPGVPLLEKPMDFALLRETVLRAARSQPTC